MNPEQAKTHHPAKRRNLRQHIEEFSGNTTFHGVQFVLGADKGIFRRIFWLLLILTGVGFLTKQLVVSYQRLQSTDYVIIKDIIDTDNRLKFPAVTICNANMMEGTKINGTDAQVYLDQLNPFRKVLSLLNTTLDKTLNISFDIEKAVLRHGHKGEDMIMLCAWDGELCSHRNFTTRFSQIVSDFIFKTFTCKTFYSNSALNIIQMTNNYIKDNHVWGKYCSLEHIIISGPLNAWKWLLSRQWDDWWSCRADVAFMIKEFWFVYFFGLWSDHLLIFF